MGSSTVNPGVDSSFVDKNSTHRKLMSLCDRIAQAADNKDWDSVFSIEKERDVVLQEVKNLDQSNLAATLTVDEKAERIGILKGIILADGRFRAAAEPKLSEMAKLLDSGANQKLIDRAYKQT